MKIIACAGVAHVLDIENAPVSRGLKRILLAAIRDQLDLPHPRPPPQEGKGGGALPSGLSSGIDLGAKIGVPGCRGPTGLRHPGCRGPSGPWHQQDRPSCGRDGAPGYRGPTGCLRGLTFDLHRPLPLLLRLMLRQDLVWLG